MYFIQCMCFIFGICERRKAWPSYMIFIYRVTFVPGKVSPINFQKKLAKQVEGPPRANFLFTHDLQKFPKVSERPSFEKMHFYSLHRSVPSPSLLFLPLLFMQIDLLWSISKLPWIFSMWETSITSKVYLNKNCLRVMACLSICAKPFCGVSCKQKRGRNVREASTTFYSPDTCKQLYKSSSK